MQPKVYPGRSLREFARGQRYAAFVLHDGSAHLGKAVVDATRVDKAPNCYFQGAGNSLGAERISVWCLLGDHGQGPDENWPIWQDPSVLPQKGAQIVYWDTETARKSYSGPYWHVGTFGTENYRYQGASGPFVSGEPWQEVKSWARLADLISWLGLRDVPWLEADARSGAQAFTAALQKAGVNLPGIDGGFVGDKHFETYGFCFLETEEDALAFIEDLLEANCAKGRSAKARYDHLNESGLLLEHGLSRMNLAIMALSSARRTHCGCHELCSYMPTQRSKVVRKNFLHGNKKQEQSMQEQEQKEQRLLEYAAIAVGINGEWSESPRGIEVRDENGNVLKVWNPLTDDGDNSRLEGRLGMHTMWYPQDIWMSCHWHDVSVGYHVFDGDRQSARRLASTKLAAKIGRAMKRQSVTQVEDLREPKM